MPEISKHYNPQDSESKWREFWEKEGIYKFDPQQKGELFSIDTPPPTVSGKMHVGHSYSFAHEDFIARYQRMRGKNVFFPFGTDDNGLATERLIEKLKKVKGSKMKRTDFINLCNDTLAEIRPEFIQDWKNLGMSCDFSKTYSTIDDHTRVISQAYFIDLFLKNRAYRKESPIAWCPQCQTAIAQAEMEDLEIETQFNDIVFKLEDGRDLVIATTRPELLSSCVTIFVHPEDKRYEELVGRKAKVPLFDSWVEIRTDEKVDQEKGTGAVMCCTFGDTTDAEWYMKHKLPLLTSIDPSGKMTEQAGKYQGLEIKEARKKIISDLQEAGLLHSQKKINHNVNIHERCKTEIEILKTKQWFVKYLDERQKSLELGEKIHWHPDFMRNRYDNWIKGLGWDWCISRQRFFGIPFPIWYCKECGEIKLAELKDLPVDPLSDKPRGKCDKCGSMEFEPEKDVMDTWATSSLTPQIALRLYYDEQQVTEILPMDLRPQAHDIISTWLFYTVVRSHFHSDKLPWENVMISGHVMDHRGRKMSKSLGNVVEPQTVASKYGSDSLRLWAASRSLGQNINYAEEEILAAKKFLTKLWNATRFVMMNLPDDKEELMSESLEKADLCLTDRWILAEMQKLIQGVTENLEKYDYSAAKLNIEKFFWLKLTDNYIEIVKNRLYDDSSQGKRGRESAQKTLYAILFNFIRLLAPFTPFITEEIYQTFFVTSKGARSVHECGWPEISEKLKSDDALHAGELLIELVGAIRKFKANEDLNIRAEIKEIAIDCEMETEKILTELIPDIKAVGVAANVVFRKIEKNSASHESEKYKLKLLITI